LLARVCIKSLTPTEHGFVSTRPTLLKRKAYRLRRLSPQKAPRPAGQLLVQPELSRPVARLRDFGGGIVPPAVAVEIEFRRKQRGLTQRQIAASIGRSQGSLRIALRGHDPISAATVNRLRELLTRGSTETSCRLIYVAR
jgi:hypothetical protein